MGSIVLIGFMGSGKTTLGQRLAKLQRCTFVDLDERLESKLGGSIRDLMQREGEAAFRQLELQTLREHVRAQTTPCVTATGGGIVETPQARPLLAQLGTVVWLHADPETCVARLGDASARRPLLDAASDWRARYEQREPLYRALAQHIVETHPADEDASLDALLRIVADDTAP